MARPAGDINAGSMADIAFLLLIFWLVTTTMDVDAGLARRLPPMPPEKQEKPPEINRRNIMEVRISGSDRLYVDGTPMEVPMLKEKVKLFITNPANDAHLPEKETKQIDGLGPFQVSKGIISLQNDRSTSYEMYIKVQNELVRAYNEVRDEFASTQFGKKQAALSENEMRILRDAYPQNISEAEPRDVSKKK